jgi:hypothetical protein
MYGPGDTAGVDLIPEGPDRLHADYRIGHKDLIRIEEIFL